VIRLLLDADGIIKLYRAGVLAQVVRAFSCAIPRAVYEEVVAEGKLRLHPDADAIDAILLGMVTVIPVDRFQQPELRLGAGELAILSLLPQEPGAIVVSDDRRFLAVLSMQGTPFLTPADILVVLSRRDILSAGEAREALERLRPAIRLAAYWDARQDLEAGRGNHEEE